MRYGRIHKTFNCSDAVRNDSPGRSAAGLVAVVTKALGAFGLAGRTMAAGGRI